MSADEKRISGGKTSDTTPVAKPGDTALRPTDRASNIAEGKAGKESVGSVPGGISASAGMKDATILAPASGAYDKASIAPRRP